MAYRDEQEALRARLAATEQRLRIAESELADTKRRLEEPLALQPSVPPASSRRVGYPPAAAHHTHDGVKAAAAVGGTVLSLMGLALLMWNLPGDEGLADIGKTLAFAVVFGLAPGGWLLYLSMRPPRRPALAVHAEPPRARIAPQTRLEPHAGLVSIDDDEAALAPPPHRARADQS